MRTVRIALFAFLAACSASAAWAQYGLYGSPETLRMPQQNTAQISPTPAGSTTATPVPQYRYPAQPPATAAYQPYQPGAQYRYPGPTTRPPVRTAAVGPAAPIPAMPAAAGASPQGAGMMNQMLAEQAGGGYGGDSGCGGAYRGTVGQFERSACGADAQGACDVAYGQYCPWYASVSALVMGRSDAPRLWTSYVDQQPDIQLTNTQFGMQWKWGGEARVGRRFCCGCVPYAIEATYWTTDAFSGSVDTTYPGGYVSTPLVVRYIDFNGVNAQSWFDGASAHRLARLNEFHNLEINLIREQLAWATDSPWDIGWSLGVRYFRFQEMLTFSSVSQDGSGDAYLLNNITNNLVGVQFGFDAAYNVLGGVRLFVTPKVGIYDNFLDSTFQAKARIGANPYVDGSSSQGTFPAHGTASGVSFLTQIDLGADWQFTRNWSVRAGYRVVAITGMGLADDQFPQYINDIPDIENVQHTGSLVLHGAFLGATYNF